MDLHAGDHRSHLILQPRRVNDRVRLANHEGLGGHAEPRREAADVGVRCAALDADQHAV